ncbi:hypothetical protein KKD03_04885, partial [Patescibacteria group bacterium]|nr:hypothetical protein [Patescibacteria group bacterium]
MEKTKKKNSQSLLKQLFHDNPKLTPKELSQLFPEYKNFHPIKDSYGLWMPTKKLDQLMTNFGKHKKIMLLMSGISAGGKDAVRKKIQELKPGFLFKAVTATTREIRKNEQNKVDYYFYNKNKFTQETQNDKFIEHTNFGGKLYGSPKQSFDDALLRSEPVVCSHVEIRDGWPGVEKYFATEYSGEKPFILKVFVVPKMNFSEYANKWLPKIRKNYKTRLEIAAWEISVAASNADIILT